MCSQTSRHLRRVWRLLCSALTSMPHGVLLCIVLVITLNQSGLVTNRTCLYFLPLFKNQVKNIPDMSVTILH